MPTTYRLKNGAEVADRRLDRLFQDDPKNAEYSVRRLLTPQETARSYTWPVGRSSRHELWLDQGKQGACVEYAFAHELAAKPLMEAFDWCRNLVQHHGLYFPAQRIDEWPGGAYPGADPFYEGTSVLAGAKVVTSMGHYLSYAWTRHVRELAVAVSRKGPVVLGVNWYEGMFNTDWNGFIAPDGDIAGGHAILCKGYNVAGDFFVLHNSWGQSWGKKGTARITSANLQRLLTEDGEACLPLRAPYEKLIVR